MNYNFNGNITVNGQPIGGGGSVYMHKINLYYNSEPYWNVFCIIYTSNSTPFTIDTLKTYLKDNGFSGGTEVNCFMNGYPLISTKTDGMGGTNWIGALHKIVYHNDYKDLRSYYIKNTLSTDGSSITNTTTIERVTTT